MPRIGRGTDGFTLHIEEWFVFTFRLLETWSPPGNRVVVASHGPRGLGFLLDRPPLDITRLPRTDAYTKEDLALFLDGRKIAETDRY